MKLHLSRALLGIIHHLAFGLALAFTAQGAVEIELVQIPASEAASASSLEARIRPLTLSEQFAATRVGALTASPSDEKIGQPGSKVTIYECGELLANATESPDRAALVIELARRKAYLMIDGMMVLETPIAVNGSGTEVPLGWQPITARTQNTPVSNLYETKPPFWLKLGDSGFGIHAGDLTGYPASGGCVRLPQRAIDTVFRHAPPGTMVYICSTWLAPISTSTAPATVAMVEEAPEEPAPARLSATPPLKISIPESTPMPAKANPVPKAPPAPEVAAPAPPRKVAAVQPTTPEPMPETPKSAPPIPTSRPEPELVAAAAPAPKPPVAATPEPKPAPKVISADAETPASRPVEDEPAPERTLPAPELVTGTPQPTPTVPATSPAPTAPAAAVPAATAPTSGRQVVRVRHLLGGFGEHPGSPSKPLTPVSGRSVAKSPKAPSRAPETVEVLTFRSLLSGGAGRQSSR